MQTKRKKNRLEYWNISEFIAIFVIQSIASCLCYFMKSVQFYRLLLVIQYQFEPLVWLYKDVKQLLGMLALIASHGNVEQ